MDADALLEILRNYFKDCRVDGINIDGVKVIMNAISNESIGPSTQAHVSAVHHVLPNSHD